MPYEQLPALNALLNALSALFVTAAWLAVKKGKRKLHRNLMLCGVFLSACFLSGYLLYHFGPVPAKHFSGHGVAKPAYFAMLISHVILAVIIVPLIGIVILFGLRGRLVQHVKVARVTLCLWMYVSVSGVLIYFVIHWWT